MAQANVPFWQDDPEAWDNVYLGGEICPGLNSIESLQGGKRKTDIKKAPGRDGASIVDQGYEPATFQIVCKINAKSDLKAWQKLTTRVRPQKAQPPEALSVIHPQLALLGIDSCYVLQLSQLARQGHDQYEGRLSCIEFIPLKNTSASGSKIKKKKPDVAQENAIKQAQTLANVFASAFIGPNTLLGAQVMQRRPSATIKPPKP